MPGKSAHVKNEKQYEALKDKGMSKERAAKIANSPDASKHGGEKSHSGSGNPSQGGTHAQKSRRGSKGRQGDREKGHLKPRTKPRAGSPPVTVSRLFSELLGTFLLVLAAAGAAVVGAQSQGAVSRAAAVTAPGLMVMAIILFMGAVSGAHLNPGVTLAFSAARRVPVAAGSGYVVAQLVARRWRASSSRPCSARSATSARRSLVSASPTGRRC